MTRSTMFQWKISKTKKRLSKGDWSIRAVVIALMGLIAILTFGLRSIAISGVYGVIPVEMPVVSAPIADPALHRFSETPGTEVKKATPAVVLTTEGFFFGDLHAFSENFSDVRDKYIVRHVDGEPQLVQLIETMEKWLDYRSQTQKIGVEDLLVLIPAGNIPMPIVIQVIAGLKKSQYFDRIILGGGLI